MSDQGAVRRDDEGEAVVADANLIDHPPHLLEAELADQPARGLIEARQVNGKRRRRQQVVVDTNRRHGDAVDSRWHRDGIVTRGVVDAARRDKLP